MVLAYDGHLVVVTTAGRNPAVSSISESITPVDPWKQHADLAEGVELAYVGTLVLLTTAGRKPAVSSQVGLSTETDAKLPLKRAHGRCFRLHWGMGYGPDWQSQCF